MTSQKIKRKRLKQPPVVLTIAGSDCSGGAGLEADLKTVAAHHVYGMAVVTCVVAENPVKVSLTHPIPPHVVEEQMVSSLKGLKKVVVKTGMLYSDSIIRACQKQISNFKFQISNLIVDPVMVATSGTRLLKEDAINSLRDLMRKHADLVTPNLNEAEILAEMPIRNHSDVEAVAKKISHLFNCSVLLKGGHLQDPQWAQDFFWNGRTGFWIKSVRIRGVRTHGTGCTYSAAIAANLALGYDMENAVRKAKFFITSAIRHMQHLGPWMALGHNVRSMLN